MIDFQEQCILNQEKAAAVAATQKSNASTSTNHHFQIGTNLLPNGTIFRTGTIYESRSSISSPYGSGSSLNRTSSIHRASLRDGEKIKKFNENFLDVLTAKDKIQEDIDENVPNVSTNTGVIPSKASSKEEYSSTTTTASTVRNTQTITDNRKSTNTPAVEYSLPPLRVPPPLPPSIPADTLGNVKRRREERRRGISDVSSAITISRLPPPSSPPSRLSPIVVSVSLPTSEINNQASMKMPNGNHLPLINDPLEIYPVKKYINLHDANPNKNRKKRICCTIL